METLTRHTARSHPQVREVRLAETTRAYVRRLPGEALEEFVVLNVLEETLSFLGCLPIAPASFGFSFTWAMTSLMRSVAASCASITELANA